MAKPTSTGSRRSRVRLAAVTAAVAVGVMAALAGAAYAQVSTDQQDYAPGSLVTVTGGNDSSGNPGYVQGHTVAVDATNIDTGWTGSCSTTITAGDGSWSCAFDLSTDSSQAVGSYTYTASSTDADGNPISETGTFTDANPAHIYFATNGLPSGTSVAVHVSSYTNPGNQSGKTADFTFDSPGGSSDSDAGPLDTLPATSVTFDFATTLTPPGRTCTFESASPSSPYTSGAGGSTTTLTATYVCVDNAPTDTTPPTITLSVKKHNSADPATVDGTSGWYNIATSGTGGIDLTATATDSSNVTSLTCTDSIDGGAATTIIDLTGGTTGTLSNSTAVVLGDGQHSIACTAVDGAGNSGASSSSTGYVAGPPSRATALYKVDQTQPSLTCVPASFLLNEPDAEVSATVSDTTSGPAATPVTASANTSSVGSKSVDLTGYDNAGNSKTQSCSYTVGYAFDGLYAPVNKPNTLNVSKAGQSIPLKWMLTDYYGVPVTTLSTVAVKATGYACDLGTSTDLIEEYASGSSGLQNLGEGYYQFNWKTPTSYARSCKTIGLDLGEGFVRTNLAMFNFTK